MTYEEAIKKWAERRWGLSGVHHVSLSEGCNEGFAYSEYTFEGGESFIEVLVCFTDNRKNKCIELHDELHTVIKEVLTIAQGD